MKQYVYTYQMILIEGYSKKSKKYLYGKNSQNIIVIVPNVYDIGKIVKIYIYACSNTVLFGFKINKLNHK
ncbi:MAG: TRAM domain-containing protein [Candidatus Shikimatogenerans sp. Tser]|uniref:TRAM domain-containing protein n=1 Tax=Candidatus Shikimatogenerans sp. Tser TaxID=3158568 RepID=A0AAU7QRL2_9FLAO